MTLVLKTVFGEKRVNSAELSEALRQLSTIDLKSSPSSVVLVNSVNNVTSQLLTAECKYMAKNGDRSHPDFFGNRENLGLGVQRALKGDFATLNRLIGNGNGGSGSLGESLVSDLVSDVKYVREQLEIHCKKNDITIKTDSPEIPVAENVGGGIRFGTQTAPPRGQQL